MLSFSEAVVTCMTKKFFTKSGRATRAEYWWFQLFVFGISFIIILFFSLGGESTSGIGLILAAVIWLICLIPNFCVLIRRLHDSGHSGFFILWNLIPYVGWLIPFIATLSDSDGDNEYGPNPFRTVLEKENMQNTSQKDLLGKQNDEFGQRNEVL